MIIEPELIFRTCNLLYSLIFTVNPEENKNGSLRSLALFGSTKKPCEFMVVAGGLRAATPCLACCDSDLCANVPAAAKGLAGS